jgi:hypothetical protein
MFYCLAFRLFGVFIYSPPFSVHSISFPFSLSKATSTTENSEKQSDFSLFISWRYVFIFFGCDLFENDVKNA